METFAAAYRGHLAVAEGTRETAVFVGISQLEYSRISLETGAAMLSNYYATGAHLSVAPGEAQTAGRHEVHG